MRQIRTGVFETNSSSMHSLVVKKTSEYYSEEELKHHMYLHEGIWDIWEPESIRFGRAPFDCLSTFESKVRYAIASLCGYRLDAEERFKEIESIVIDVVRDCVGISLPEIDYYNEETDEDEPHLCYGGVDEDILTPFLEETGVSLKEFLTNKKYVVIVDGDEYCIWNSLKKSGLVNMDEIEKEFGY